MSRRSIVIIGAGIAGLSAGCYAQRNGYTTRIFETQRTPGGWCTGWKRRGYTVDGCLHHLAGMRETSPIYRIYSDLGIFPELPFIKRDHLVQVEDAEGQRLTLYCDPDRLEQHMMELAPADAAPIKAYTGAIRSMRNLELLAMGLKGIGGMIGLIPRAPFLMKWGGVSLGKYAERFSSPFLRRAFPVLQYDFPELPVLIHLNFMAGMWTGNFGWPKGGAKAIGDQAARRYAELGGVLSCGSRVKRIIVEDHDAKGVVLEDGSEHRADTVVAACDGHSVIYDMLGGRYTNEQIDGFYEGLPDRQDMNYHVAFGLDRDMRDEPCALTYFLREPVTILGKERDHLNLEIYHFDPSLAPEGKTAVKVLFDASYSRWKELRKDREQYDVGKRKVADTVVGALEERFPGISRQVEMVDVATPVTIERYTGSYHGLQAEVPKGKAMSILTGGWCPTLPGLRNFRMVGQWAGGLGISTGAIGGRQLVKRLCKEDGKAFR